MLDDYEVTHDLRDDIAFFKGEVIECPICSAEVPLEDLKTGGGRLDAGDLRNDLHRLYLRTEEHGEVFPIMYMVYTCNSCYYSAFKFDFSSKFRKATMENLSSSKAKEKRKTILNNMFSEYPDFKQSKTLLSGLAAYVLALATYDSFSHEDSPSIRMAICALRAAWLCGHIMENVEEAGVKEAEAYQKVFYRKAYFLFNQAIERGITGEEDIGRIQYYGPDYDKEYGYDGVIYIVAWLFINYGRSHNAEEKEMVLRKIKSSLSKVFGFGKASKEKPSALLGIARETYEKIDEELKKFEI